MKLLNCEEPRQANLEGQHSCRDENQAYVGPAIYGKFHFFNYV